MYKALAYASTPEKLFAKSPASSIVLDRYFGSDGGMALEALTVVTVDVVLLAETISAGLVEALMDEFPVEEAIQGTQMVVTVARR